MALPCLWPERHRGRHRVAVGAGVGGVEQLHGLEVHLAALQDEAEVVADRQLRVEHGGEGLVDEGVDGLVLLAEDPGVVGVGGDPLEAVGQELAQRLCVGVGGRGLHARPLGHVDQRLR